MAPRPLTPRCLVRVAAGPRLGYGHLMRARALVDQLAMQVTVSVRGGRAAARTATSMGLRLVNEAAALEGSDLLIVDDPSLKHGRPWIARARRAGVPTVSVHDDVHVHEADLVLCGSIGVGQLRASGIALNGPKFYPLDRRIGSTFRKRPARSSPGNSRVLIALGGGEHVRRVAQQLALAIRRYAPKASISVAAGFSRSPRPRLRGARWLSVRKGLTQALATCDVAVVAGGVTLYEACALGTPAVALAVVPAQRRAIRAFSRLGAVVDAGADTVTVERAGWQVAQLLEDGRRRWALAGRSRRLVDGLGAKRAAQHIRAMLSRGGCRVA